MTYENALKELESIIKALENDSIEIDELSEKSKRAAELMTFCKDKLRNIETEVKEVLK